MEKDDLIDYILSQEVEELPKSEIKSTFNTIFIIECITFFIFLLIAI